MNSSKLRHAPEGWKPGLTRVRASGPDTNFPGAVGTFVRNSYPLPGHTPAAPLGVLVRFDFDRDLIDVDPAELAVICERDPFAVIRPKLPSRYAPGATDVPYDYPGPAGTWYPVIYYPSGVVEKSEGPIWLVEPYPAERADGSDGCDPIDSAGVAVVRCDAAPRPRGTDLDGDWIIPGKALGQDCAYDAYVTNQPDLLAAWVEAYAIAAALNHDLACNASLIDALNLDPRDIEVLLAAERRQLVDTITEGPQWWQIGAKPTEALTAPDHQFTRLRDSNYPMIAAVKTAGASTLYGLTSDGVKALDAIRKAGFEHGGPRCRVCGCTHDRACEGGCSWVTLGDPGPLCSACFD